MGGGLLVNPGTHNALARLYAAQREFRVRCLERLPSSVVVLDGYLVVPAERPVEHSQSLTALRRGDAASAAQILPGFRGTTTESVTMPFLVLDSKADKARAVASTGLAAEPLSPTTRLPTVPPTRRAQPAVVLRNAGVELQRALEMYTQTLGLSLPPLGGGPGGACTDAAGQLDSASGQHLGRDSRDGEAGTGASRRGGTSTALVARQSRGVRGGEFAGGGWAEVEDLPHAVAAALANTMPLYPLCLEMASPNVTVAEPESIGRLFLDAGITNALLRQHLAFAADEAETRVQHGMRGSVVHSRRHSLSIQASTTVTDAADASDHTPPRAADAFRLLASNSQAMTVPAGLASRLLAPQTVGERAAAVGGILGLRFIQADSDGGLVPHFVLLTPSDALLLAGERASAPNINAVPDETDVQAHVRVLAQLSRRLAVASGSALAPAGSRDGAANDSGRALSSAAPSEPAGLADATGLSGLGSIGVGPAEASLLAPAPADGAASGAASLSIAAAAAASASGVDSDPTMSSTGNMVPRKTFSRQQLQPTTATRSRPTLSGTLGRGASKRFHGAAARTGHERQAHEGQVLRSVRVIQRVARFFLWRRQQRSKIDAWLHDEQRSAEDPLAGLPSVGMLGDMSVSYWERREHWAAKLVQTHWREKVTTFRRERSACVLQRAWRCHVARIHCLARSIELSYRECGVRWPEQASLRASQWGTGIHGSHGTAAAAAAAALASVAGRTEQANATARLRVPAAIRGTGAGRPASGGGPGTSGGSEPAAPPTEGRPSTSGSPRAGAGARVRSPSSPSDESVLSSRFWAGCDGAEQDDDDDDDDFSDGVDSDGVPPIIAATGTGRGSSAGAGASPASRRRVSPGFDMLVPGHPAVIHALRQAAAEAVLAQGGLSAVTLRARAWIFRTRTRRLSEAMARHSQIFSMPGLLGKHRASVALSVASKSSDASEVSSPSAHSSVANQSEGPRALLASRVGAGRLTGRRTLRAVGTGQGAASLASSMQSNSAGESEANALPASITSHRRHVTLPPASMQEVVCAFDDGYWQPAIRVPYDDVLTNRQEALEALEAAGIMGASAYAAVVWPERSRTVRHSWVRQGEAMIDFRIKERTAAILQHKAGLRRHHRAKKLKALANRRSAQVAAHGGSLPRRLALQFQREHQTMQHRWSLEDAADRHAAAELAHIMVNPLHFRRRRGSMQLASDGVLRRLPSVAEAIGRSVRRARVRRQRKRGSMADVANTILKSPGRSPPPKQVEGAAAAQAVSLPRGRVAPSREPAAGGAHRQLSKAVAVAAAVSTVIHRVPLVVGGLGRVRGAHSWFGITTALAYKLRLLGSRAGVPSSGALTAYKSAFVDASKAARALAAGGDAPGSPGARSLFRLVMPTPLLLARVIHRFRWHLQRAGMLGSKHRTEAEVASAASSQSVPRQPFSRAGNATPSALSGAGQASAHGHSPAGLPLEKCVLRLSHSAARAKEPVVASDQSRTMLELRAYGAVRAGSEEGPATGDGRAAAGGGGGITQASSSSSTNTSRAGRKYGISRRRRRSSITVALTSELPRFHRSSCAVGPPTPCIFGWQAAQISAAVAIQATWRSVLSRFRLRPPAPHRLLERRAVVCVQRAVRARHFRRRVGLLRAVKAQAAAVLVDNSPTLFVELRTVEALARGMVGSGQGPVEPGPGRAAWAAVRAPWGSHPLPEHLLEIGFDEQSDESQMMETAAVAAGRAGGGGRRGSGLFLGSSPSRESGADVTGATGGPQADPPGRAGGAIGDASLHEVEARQARAGASRDRYMAVRPVEPTELPAAWHGRRVGLPDWLGWSIPWISGGGRVRRKVNLSRGEASWGSDRVPGPTPSARAVGYPLTAVPLLSVDVGVERVRHGFRQVRAASPHPAASTQSRISPQVAADYRQGYNSQLFESKASGEALESVDVPEWAARAVPMLAVTFPSVLEARTRACMLLAMTWDAPRGDGARLWTATQLWEAWEGMIGVSGTALAGQGSGPTRPRPHLSTYRPRVPSPWTEATNATWLEARTTVLGQQAGGGRASVMPGHHGAAGTSPPLLPNAFAASAAGPLRPQSSMPTALLTQSRLDRAATRWSRAALVQRAAVARKAVVDADAAMGPGAARRPGAWVLPAASPVRASSLVRQELSALTFSSRGRLAEVPAGDIAVFKPLRHSLAGRAVTRGAQTAVGAAGPAGFDRRQQHRAGAGNEQAGASAGDSPRLPSSRAPSPIARGRAASRGSAIFASLPHRAESKQSSLRREAAVSGPRQDGRGSRSSPGSAAPRRPRSGSRSGLPKPAAPSRGNATIRPETSSASMTRHAHSVRDAAGVEPWRRGNGGMVEREADGDWLSGAIDAESAATRVMPRHGSGEERGGSASAAVMAARARVEARKSDRQLARGMVTKRA